ncbi:MAG: MEDS domain-containing protein [Burkholderiaceae bacterium]
MKPTGLLTIDEAARYLSVSKSSLRRWTRLETLACVRVGARRERRFRREDLDRFLDPNTPSTTPMLEAATLPSVDPLQALRAAALAGVPRHVCLHFRDRDELWQLFRPYVLEHATQKQAIVYIHEENSRADVLARLRGEGLDPKRMIADGLLRLLVPSEAYLRTGSFAPERMIDFVEGAILDRRAAGHEAMLVSGEMTWRLSGAPGVEDMDEYEMRLNDLLQRYPKVTIVCHYDMHRLSGAVTLGALCTHPHVQLPTGLLPGYFARAQAQA